MQYKGYTIEQDHGYYLVVGPGGMWTADTVEEAKADIDEREDN